MNNQLCHSCRFWEEYKNEQGQCHRYPPVFNSEELRRRLDWHEEQPEEGEENMRLETKMIREMESLQVWYFPVTDEADWCGEWKADK